MLPPPHLGSSKDQIRHAGTQVSNVPILRQEGGLLSQVFFAPKNLDVLQNSLRYRVYRESGGQFIVGRQSDIELLSIMRDIYESSQRHVPDSQVLHAVQRLKEHVLQKAVPNDYYLRDINQPNPVPEDRPQLMSTKGSKGGAPDPATSAAFNETFVRIRESLGQGILIGLEFLIISDIFESVSKPLEERTMQDLFKLGTVVLIRTVIDLSLHFEG